MERGEVGDRQLEALLERLDRIGDELHAMNRHLAEGHGLERVVHELRKLEESLNALAYAALGRQGPQVRRRPPD